MLPMLCTISAISCLLFAICGRFYDKNDAKEGLKAGQMKKREKTLHKCYAKML